MTDAEYAERKAELRAMGLTHYQCRNVLGMLSAERERCAKLCEVEAAHWADNHGESATECAALIRSQKGAD